MKNTKRWLAREIELNRMEALAGIRAKDEFWAGEYAERAAHAAFRAFPALRG